MTLQIKNNGLMHQVKKTLKLIRVSVLEGEEVNNLKENVDYLSFQRYSWRLDLMPRTKMVQPFYTHVHNPAITVLLLGFIKPGLDEAQLNPGGFSFLCASGVVFFFLLVFLLIGNASITYFTLVCTDSVRDLGQLFCFQKTGHLSTAQIHS